MEFAQVKCYSGDICSTLEKLNDQLVELAYTLDEVATIESVDYEELNDEINEIKSYIFSGSTGDIYGMFDRLNASMNQIQRQYSFVSNKLTNLTKKVNSIYTTTFEEIEALSGEVGTMVEDKIEKSYYTNSFKKNVKKLIGDGISSFLNYLTKNKTFWQNQIINY